MNNLQNYDLITHLISEGFEFETLGHMQLFQLEEEQRYFALTIHHNRFITMANETFFQNNYPIPQTRDETEKMLSILLK